MFFEKQEERKKELRWKRKDKSCVYVLDTKDETKSLKTETSLSSLQRRLLKNINGYKSECKKS